MKLLLISALCVLVLLLAMNGPVVRTYTCLYSREMRTEKTYVRGFTRTIIQATECSEWVDDQFPEYERAWRWSGSVSRSGINGFLGSGRRHPVWQVSPEVQLVFLQGASAEERQRYFTLLESMDEEDSDQAIEMAYSAFEARFR